MENNGCKVSIIIPVYQAKDTLRECVLSCVDQKNISPDEIEIILVDDGSTDGSADVCDELERELSGHIENVDEAAEKDGNGGQTGSCRIKVLHGKNFGVSHARNIGMERAEGKYITFVDADDTVSDSFLSDLLAAADDGAVLVDETKSYNSDQKISGFNYIENATLNEDTHVWGKLFDRKTIEGNHIRFDEKLTIGEDLLFMLDFALSQGKERTIRCIPEGGYNYNFSEEGAMNSEFKESYMDQITAWRAAEERLLPHSAEISRYAFVSLSASQIMTALLVAGKIAVLDEDKRDKDITDLAITEVKTVISHALKTKGTFAGLSFGYKLKVILFKLSPDLYLSLYGKHKA